MLLFNGGSSAENTRCADVMTDVSVRAWLQRQQNRKNTHPIVVIVPWGSPRSLDALSCRHDQDKSTSHQNHSHVGVFQFLITMFWSLRICLRAVHCVDTDLTFLCLRVVWCHPSPCS